MQAPSGKGAVQALFENDAREAQAFVERWRPRVEAVGNARHKGMLNVILGETIEQQRFFEQALAGRTGSAGPPRGCRRAGSGRGVGGPDGWNE